MINAGDIIWGIKVEGVGPSQPPLIADARYRFTQRTPSVDPYGLYLDVLDEASPGRVGFDVDLKSSRSSIGSLDVSLLATPQVTAIFSRLRPVASASVGASVSPAATTISLGASFTGKGGRAVWVRREAVLLGGESSPGVYACVRGIFGTPAQRHDPSEPGADVEVFEVCPVLQGRRVELFWTTGSGYGDEHTVWTGALDDAGHKGLAAKTLRVLGLLGLVRDLELLPRQWAARVLSVYPGVFEQGPLSFPDMTATLEPVVPEWSNDDNLVPAAMPDPPALGDTCFVALGESIFRAELVNATTSPYRYRLSTARPWRDWTPPLQRVEEVHRGMVAREVWISDPESLGINVVEIILRVLTSTPDGDNGAYDLGADLGIGLPVGFVDVVGMERLRDRLGAAHVERLVLGLEDRQTPTLALDWIEGKLLHPFGLVFALSEEGLLTLAQWEELPPYAVVEITDDDLLEEPEEVDGYTALVDQVRFVYTPHEHLLGDTRLVDVRDAVRRRRLLGTGSSDQVDAAALSDAGLVYQLALSRLLRWRDPLPVVSCKVRLGLDVAVGRAVRLTLSGIVGVGAGGQPVEGVEGSEGIVVSKDVDILEGSTTYKILHIGVGLGRLGRIAPSARVTTWDAVAKTASVEVNRFVPASGSGTFDNDPHSFEDKGAVQVLDEFGAVVISAGTLASVGVGTLTFTAALVSVARPAGPIAGDVIVPANYTSATPAQTNRFAWIANSDGELSGDQGYEYTN